MSNALALDPIRRPAPLPPLPRAVAAVPPEAAPALRPASAFRVRRGRVLAAGGIVAGIGCVLAAQLLLSIETADDAFQLQHLQVQAVQVGREVQVRTERLEVLSAPQHLATLATRLGMVASGAPSALRLSDGRVLTASGSGPLPSGTETVPIGDALIGDAPAGR